LPALFGEQELSIFLKQFGNVLNVRVSRSKKTGGSRGYAFCQFQDPDVANIVAETLSGYLLFDAKQHIRKRLVCHVVPNDKVHPKLFYGRIANKKKITQPTKASTTSSRSLPEITARLVERERQKRKALEAAGIEYDFPGYEAGLKKSERQTISFSTSDQKDSKKHKTNHPSSNTKDASEIALKADKKKRKDSVTSMEESESSFNSKSRADEATETANEKNDPIDKAKNKVSNSTSKKQQQSSSSKTDKQKTNDIAKHLPMDDAPSSSSKTRADSLGSVDEKSSQKNRNISSAMNSGKEKEKTHGMLQKETKGDRDSTSIGKKRKDTLESASLTAPDNTTLEMVTVDNKKLRSDSMDSENQDKDSTRAVQSDTKKKKKKKKKNKNRQSV
jgi:nucleolar protein 15